MISIDKNICLYQSDTIAVLDKLIQEGKKFDMIFADPPYNLSNGGMSVHAGKRVKVDKGAWDVSHGREKDEEFTFTWIKKCREVLSDNGTIWISGTLHSIYMVGYLLKKLNFFILNDIAWFKPNAPPHLACRYYAHAHETILWARKSKSASHNFNYDLMKTWDTSKDMIKNPGKQMRSVWSIPTSAQSEKKHGKHPTQKPLEVLKRIVLSSTNENDFILDPFCGSGTTGVVAKKYNRKFIGIDNNLSFIEMATKRLKDTQVDVKFFDVYKKLLSVN